jgi:hypothetical protein
MDIKRRGGYFTWLKMVCDKPAAQLAADLGFAPGSLDDGWCLLMPRWPISASQLELRGTTRWPIGMLPNGDKIADLIEQRSDAHEAKRRVASFFDKHPDHRPVKVLPPNRPDHYPPAEPVGIPQFELLQAIDWVVVKSIPQGGVLRQGSVPVPAF